MSRKLHSADRNRKAQGRSSARNGKPKHVALKHGGKGAFISAREVFQANTGEARFEVEYITAGTAHLGGQGEVTQPQAQILQMCARLALLEHLLWADVLRHGAVREGEVAPAVPAFISTTGRRTELMKTLGLARHAKRVPTLAELLAQPPSNPDVLPPDTNNDDSN